MTTADTIDRARSAYARRAWTEAAEAFEAADRILSIDLDDLERAGLAAHLIGRDEYAIELLSRAHHLALDAGDIPRSARHAFWIGMMLSQRGDMARGGGWLSRARRMIEEPDIDCVERGFVLVPEAIGRLEGGDIRGGYELFDRAGAIADRFGDPDLATLSRMGRGRALVDLGEVARGVALLDEAMVAVTADEVSPVVAGIVYCASIEAFHEIFDLRRAQEWTAALGAWCDAQPDLIPFRGRCLVYRADLMRLHGAWTEAMDEARRAQEWLSRPPPEPAVGEAFYQQAELYRLRGDYRHAEAAYREASQWGRRPEPGLALLRLGQGQVDAAASMMIRGLDEAIGDVARARMLEPHIEIALAAGDLARARQASDELARISTAMPGPLTSAIADRAEGAVLLGEGKLDAALRVLRRASAGWQQMDAPYESARVRALIAQALRSLGDSETAGLEFEAARRVFDSLGAAPDVARVDALLGSERPRSDGLSAREVDVLRLLAAGRTNRAIASELGISERTVDRHVSNIFSKLDVSSRVAATAYAYDHDIR
jgi:DNA-binding NarL/FixJ family response regulator